MPQQQQQQQQVANERTDVFMSEAATLDKSLQSIKSIRFTIS